MSRKAFGIGAGTVFVLMAVGILGMVIAPGPITGLGVPLGFTLWAVLYWLLKRRGKPQLPTAKGDLKEVTIA